MIVFLPQVKHPHISRVLQTNNKPSFRVIVMYLCLLIAMYFSSGRNKGQKLVGQFLKIGHFVGY